MRPLRILLAAILFLAGILAIASSPRQARLELAFDSCYVTRGHPLSPERLRVAECRLELQGDHLLVRGPQSVTFFGPHHDMATALVRVDSGLEVRFTSVDGFDLSLAFIALVLSVLTFRSAGEREEHEVYLDEVIHAFRR